MSNILLCNQSLSRANLQSQCGIDIDQLSGFMCAKPTIVTANTPYLINNNITAAERNILSTLTPHAVTKELTNLSLSFGGDNVVALSEIVLNLKGYDVELMGASASAYTNRMGGFTGAVKDYQSALMQYRDAITSKSPTKNVFKEKAHTAFNKMQTQFGKELKVITGKTNARRGTPLTNVTRGTNIAESSRNTAKLNVSSQVQANNLVKLTKHAKFLGSGLAAISFTSKAGNVQNSYKAGGNWEKELFIESSSFAASAIVGSGALKIGAAGLTFLMLATPIGWVGLIIGGVAVLGSAAGASIMTNNYINKNGSDLYDNIMKLVSDL
jgi:hypothetical protein